jgi:putative restriction endonuclease
MPRDVDQQIRLAAFDWLSSQVAFYGDILPRTVLAQGFMHEGLRVPLLGPQGIFKPKALPEMPLSITTVPSGPYDDHFGPDGLLRYAYRGTDPQHRDNMGLRQAMASRVPLVYFHGIAKGKYLAAWPVYVITDDSASLTFTIALDDAHHVSSQMGEQSGNGEVVDAGDTGRRVYITSTFRRRLHQQTFRERVLRAYREQCALCRLRHRELLDAAHIIADTAEGGDPVVQNGLSLCKLHHAAYDKYFLTVRPDYIIEVRRDVLEEEDGPMLIHGLKGLHNKSIVLPRSRQQHPDPARLETRFERFRETI